jgi:hypothetical protein
MAWLQLLLLLLIVVFLPGCAIAGGIFKAGAWVGALAVETPLGAGCNLALL